MTQEAFDDVLERALANDAFSCAVAAVGNADGEVHRLVLGEADPERGIAATGGTVFDCASVTKAVVTTTVVLRLVERGELALSDALGRHLAELAGRRRGDVELRQLLSHTSGLQPYHFSTGWAGYDDARAGILGGELLEAEPGTRHEYSCLNFAHLAMVAEAATGEELPALAEELVFAPTGMKTAAVGTPADDATVAVTRDRDYGRGTLRGEIHDPIAAAFGGRSGNAGLFATVEDLSRFARTLLRDAKGEGTLLAPTTIARMVGDRTPEGVDSRGYGWLVGEGLSPAPTWSDNVAGHTGYTGTSLWLDLERGRYCVILTNEVYEGKDGKLPRVRELVHGAAGAIPEQ